MPPPGGPAGGGTAPTWTPARPGVSRPGRPLLEALVALVDEGATQPDPPRRSPAGPGVSARIVYHHFAGVRQLLEAGV